MPQYHVERLSAPLSPELPLPTGKGVDGLAARKGFVVVAGDSEAGDY